MLFYDAEGLRGIFWGLGYQFVPNGLSYYNLSIYKYISKRTYSYLRTLKNLYLQKHYRSIPFPSVTDTYKQRRKIGIVRLYTYKQT